MSGKLFLKTLRQKYDARSVKEITLQYFQAYLRIKNTGVFWHTQIALCCSMKFCTCARFFFFFFPLPSSWHLACRFLKVLLPLSVRTLSWSSPMGENRTGHEASKILRPTWKSQISKPDVATGLHKKTPWRLIYVYWWPFQSDPMHCLYVVFLPANVWHSVRILGEVLAVLAALERSWLYNNVML